MKRITLFFAIILCWTSESLAQSTNMTSTLSIEQAITFALKQHPAIRESKHLKQAAEFRVDQIRSTNLPQLNFNSSFTRWDWALPNKKLYLGNSMNDLYAEFTVQQLVYNGGRTSIQSDLARNLVDVEGLNNQRLQQTIVFFVTRAYLLLLKAERIVAIQELTIANLRDHLATADLLYTTGKVSQLDLLKAQTQIALADEELVKANNAVTGRRLELFGAMGIDTPYDFVTVDVTEQLPHRNETLSIHEDSLRSLLNRHPDLQRAKLDVQRRKEEISLARTDYYPTVQVHGSYNWEDSQVLPGNKNWNIGIGLSLPLFQGGATQASVDEAASRTEAALATEETLRQRLLVAVRTTLNTIDDTRSRIRSASQIIYLAEETEKVASLKYRSGKGSNLEVIDSETILTAARISYIQVVTDYAVALAELNLNLGNAGGLVYKLNW